MTDGLARRQIKQRGNPIDAMKRSCHQTVDPQLKQLYGEAEGSGKRAVITALSAIGGKAAIQFLIERLPELLRVMSEKKIEPKRLRCVHSRAGSGAVMVLVEGRKNGKPGMQEEFLAKKTREAQIAHDADQLEMILALKEYKDLGNRYADEWYPVTVKRLQTDVARELAETIWETDSSLWSLLVNPCL